jgi:hypothetical protein
MTLSNLKNADFRAFFYKVASNRPVKTGYGNETPAPHCYNHRLRGRVDERFKSYAWKAYVGLNPPRVRIPPLPPKIQPGHNLIGLFFHHLTGEFSK